MRIQVKEFKFRHSLSHVDSAKFYEYKTEINKGQDIIFLPNLSYKLVRPELPIMIYSLLASILTWVGSYFWDSGVLGLISINLFILAFLISLFKFYWLTSFFNVRADINGYNRNIRKWIKESNNFQEFRLKYFKKYPEIDLRELYRQRY